jgi:hypothetical protein
VGNDDPLTGFMILNIVTLPSVCNGTSLFLTV